MGDTPKIPKGRGRCSLSLKKRLNKRLSSPQKCMNGVVNATDLLDSPKVAIGKEPNEFTPPHKKLNLDESFDDSPLSFEGCHSPTTFLSQTFGSDSPEVGWRWTQDDNELTGAKGNTKADSGFSSNNSSSYMDYKLRRTRSEANRQAYLNKREEKLRAKEAELRKAEKARVEALLRERLASLESQFKGTQTSVQQTPKDKVEIEVVEVSPIRTENEFEDIDVVFEDSNLDFAVTDAVASSNVQNVKPADSLDDFFNDSDDGMLIAATQQLESTIPEVTKSIVNSQKSFTPKKDIKSMSSNETNHRSCNEKRSSLYTQFLEDDEDDFFVSLDDDWLQRVTQTNKPRSPFQRYNSMPATTAATATGLTSSAVATRSSTDKNCDKKNVFPNWNIKNGAASNSSSASHNIKIIKRHASSHAMTSPSSTNYRR